MKHIIHHPSVRKHVSQLWKFMIVGGLGAMIDLGSLTVFVEAFGFREEYSVFPSTILAVIVVFTLNKFFTFKNHEGGTGGQALKFAFVYGVAILSNVTISALLITIGVHYLAAKIIAIGCGAVWNYALSHGFVFRKKEKEVVVV